MTELAHRGNEDVEVSLFWGRRHDRLSSSSMTSAPVTLHVPGRQRESAGCLHPSVRVRPYDDPPRRLPMTLTITQSVPRNTVTLVRRAWRYVVDRPLV
jgi:hypothetical protein